MTNELIEAIPSPLWLITKPGGYKHINQFGRVYRTRELALRHCDVNEMVVELRLAPAPEPGAVSPDQSLRGMAVYADEVPPIPAPEASIMKAFARSPRRVPTRDADHCDYPDCEQHWTMVLDRALAAMTKFHATFLTPRTTSEAFREFVDEHARLLNIRASAPSAAQPAVSAPSHEGAGEATGGAVPSDAELLAALQSVYEKVNASQTELDPEARRVLHESRRRLYRRDPDMKPTGGAVSTAVAILKGWLSGPPSESDEENLRLLQETLAHRNRTTTAEDLDEPGADNLHGGKARLACGCIDICTNQRDHDAHGQKSGEQA